MSSSLRRLFQRRTFGSLGGSLRKFRRRYPNPLVSSLSPPMMPLVPSSSFACHGLSTNAKQDPTTTATGKTNQPSSPLFRDRRKRVIDVDTWKTTTLRLLTEPWRGDDDWKSAQRNLNWWIHHPGGGYFCFKLVQCMLQQQQEQHALPTTAVSNVLTTRRLKSIVERWAMDHAQNAHETEDQNEKNQFSISPIEVATMLKSCAQNEIPIEASILELIHNVATGKHVVTLTTITQENLLSTLEFVIRTGDQRACPDRSVVDEILRQASKQIEQSESLSLWAQEVLDKLWWIDKHHPGLKMRPDYSMYLSVMRAWFNSNEPRIGERMKHLLDEMEAYSMSGVTGLFPGTPHFTLMLEEYTRRGDAKDALELIHYIKARHQATGMGNYEQTRRMYALCLQALAESDDRDQWWLAETLKNDLLDQAKVQKNVLPRQNFWMTYIGILARAATETSLETAEDTLDEMETVSGHLTPTLRHYGLIIRGWAQIQRPERAEQLLHQMIDQYASGNLQAKPDSKTFLDVINAWARSGDAQARDRIRQLTRLMDQVVQEPTGHKSRLTDKAVEKSSGRANDGVGDLVKMLSAVASDEDAERAEQILLDAVKQKDEGNSNIRIAQLHYQAVVTAWSRTKDVKSLDRATSLFQEMLNRYDRGDESLRPSEHGYTAIIHACAKSGREDCGDKGQAWFDNMKERFQAGEDSLRPTVQSYSALINAWAAARKPDHAERVLLEMHDDFLNGNDAAKPSLISFNTVLHAWSKHNSNDALERATEVFRLMQDLGDSYLHIKPDIITYATAISCCICSNEPCRVEVAESLFNEAQQRFSAGHEECRPNSVLYGALIQTIARSDLEDAAELSERYLKEMLTLPDFNGYQVLLSHNIVLHAWAKHADGLLALERAETLVWNLLELSRRRRNRGCAPNLHTYAFLLRILSKSGTTDKDVRLRATIAEMESLGLEADDTIKELIEKCSFQ